MLTLRTGWRGGTRVLHNLAADRSHGMIRNNGMPGVGYVPRATCMYPLNIFLSPQLLARVHTWLACSFLPGVIVCLLAKWLSNSHQLLSATWHLCCFDYRLRPFAPNGQLGVVGDSVLGPQCLVCGHLQPTGATKYGMQL